MLPRSWMAASLALPLLACGEGTAPRIVDVTVPPLAFRGDGEIAVAARVADDRGVARVEAVVLDPQALAIPAIVDGIPIGSYQDPEAFRQHRAFEHVRDDLWTTTLEIPPSGDLFFYVVAADEDGLLAEAPGKLTVGQPAAAHNPPERRLYQIPIFNRTQDCGPGLPPCPSGSSCQSGSCVDTDFCRGTICRPGYQCEPSSGTCLPVGHCRLPSNRCPAGQACNAATGQCEGGLDPCEWVMCPVGEVCLPATGECVDLDDCAYFPCPELYQCNYSSRRCELIDPCRGVQCPDWMECNPEDQLCHPRPGTLCAPCSSIYDCREAKSYCVLYPNGRGCGRDCSQTPCPDGYICREYSAGIRQCYHISGSCQPADW